MTQRKSTTILLALSMLIGGCAQEITETAAPDEFITLEMAKTSTAPLAIYLHHPNSVDLDLFVTDPFDESTYYGNSPASRGSRLVNDTLCSSAQEQAIEVIEFPDPASGRYRISLDFPQSCDGRVKEVPYLVMIDSGGQQKRLRGTIKYQHFLLVVDEFDYPDNQ
jgi:hypothetical protein